MISNSNEFNGQGNFYQINIYIDNKSTPQTLPDPAPKKDKLAVFKSVMAFVYEGVKWILKFIPLFVPLLSG